MALSTRILSLFTGLGGIDLGIEIAAPNARVVCAVERDAYCASLLAQSMEQGRLSPAPIWDDVRTFDGRRWRGSVDCVTAGYPCQPFSVAGQKRGADDPRHLWPDVARIVGECAAPLVFLENVSRYLSAGFDVVTRDLQSMGYTVAALVCRASTVGAPQQRERLFALAVSADGHQRIRELADDFSYMVERLANAHGGTWQGGMLESVRRSQRGDVADGASKKLGYADGIERDQGCGLGQPAGLGSDQPEQDVADSHGDGLQGEWRAECGNDWGHAPRREPDGCSGSELDHANVEQCQPMARTCGKTGRAKSCDTGCWPPGPNDLERWATAPVELWPSVESPVRGVAHGIPDGLGFRRNQLHALGNSVVPLQAAYAFATLAKNLD